MKSLERRIDRLEGGGPDDELIEVAGIKTTRRALHQMLREIDGKTRGLPSEMEGFKCQAT